MAEGRVIDSGAWVVLAMEVVAMEAREAQEATDPISVDQEGIQAQAMEEVQDMALILAVQEDIQEAVATAALGVMVLILEVR